jgi:cell division protein FtsL
MSQFHIVSKRIDNSRLVRVDAPGRWRELLKQVGVGSLLAGVMFLYAWQHFQSVQMGYQIESLKAQQSQMAELNRQLKLEVAGLQSPARIDEIARRQLGLAAPAAGQLQPLEAPSEPILAEMRPAERAHAR